MSWKVPEQFRKADAGPLSSCKGEPFGLFVADSPDKSRGTRTVLEIIASCGDPSIGIEWEHVSVKAVKTYRSRRERKAFREIER